MKPTDFGGPLTFPLAPPFLFLIEIIQQLLDELPLHLVQLFMSHSGFIEIGLGMQ